VCSHEERFHHFIRNPCKNNSLAPLAWHCRISESRETFQVRVVLVRRIVRPFLVALSAAAAAKRTLSGNVMPNTNAAA